MSVNQIITDPTLTILFPDVTESEMTQLLAEAQSQGAKVVESTPGDVSLNTITYHKLFWTVEALCFWDVVTGLTIQISDAKYRSVVQSQVSVALAKIRSTTA